MIKKTITSRPDKSTPFYIQYIKITKDKKILDAVKKIKNYIDNKGIVVKRFFSDNELVTYQIVEFHNQLQYDNYIKDLYEYLDIIEKDRKKYTRINNHIVDIS